MMTTSATIIGLTGPMGAGKSTIATMMREEGFAIVDADSLVARMYGDDEFLDQLAHEWGLVWAHDPKRQISDMIAQQPQRLARLEEICQPRLMPLVRDTIEVAGQMSSVVVFDAPLLYELGLRDLCGDVILVSAHEEVRRRRVMARPGMTEAKMLTLMARQLRDDDLSRLSDVKWIVGTDQPLAQVRCEVLKIVAAIRGEDQ